MYRLDFQGSGTKLALASSVRNLSGTLCALLWLAVGSAAAQTYWKINFDSTNQFWGPSAFAESQVSSGSFDATITNLGPPHNNALRFDADCSNQTASPWTTGCDVWSIPGSIPPTIVYDPTHTDLKFDVLASAVRPVHVRVQFATSNSDARNLDVSVMPANTNRFQTFLVPLWAFTNTTTVLSGVAPPSFPTALEFSISGNLTNATTCWPPAADNMFMVDNVAYIVEPPLSAVSSGANMTLAWPTNTEGFSLEETGNFVTWIMVTNTPVLTDGLNEVVVSAAGPRMYYRLVGP